MKGVIATKENSYSLHADVAQQTVLLLDSPMGQRTLEAGCGQVADIDILAFPFELLKEVSIRPLWKQFVKAKWFKAQ